MSKTKEANDVWTGSIDTLYSPLFKAFRVSGPLFADDETLFPCDLGTYISNPEAEVSQQTLAPHTPSTIALSVKTRNIVKNTDDVPNNGDWKIEEGTTSIDATSVRYLDVEGYSAEVTIVPSPTLKKLYPLANVLIDGKTHTLGVLDSPLTLNMTLPHRIKIEWNSDLYEAFRVV